MFIETIPLERTSDGFYIGTGFSNIFFNGYLQRIEDDIPVAIIIEILNLNY